MDGLISNEDYERYKPLLRGVCRKYIRYGVDMDDLMQMAYFGLHDAFKTYAFEKCGEGFEIHIKFRAKYAILHELNKVGAYGNTTIHLRRQLKPFRQAKKKLELSLMRMPYNWEIARELNVTAEKVDELEQALKLFDADSLDKPFGDYEDYNLIDVIADTDNSAMEAVERDELRRVLWPVVKKALTNREYDVVHEHYLQGVDISVLAKVRAEKEHILYDVRRSALGKLRINREVRQIGEDYGYYGVYRHVGAREFNRTRTSAVEDEVIKKEWWGKRATRVRM
ncbi:MAG: hypothetical protein FWF47_06790 [Clostridia bacterium]|nr:hypothetical protein [Clostridia bacterium]